MSSTHSTSGKWQWTFFGIAILIALACYLICMPGRSGADTQPVAPPAPFGSANYNLVKTDTFVQLLHQAYGSLAADHREGDRLIVEMKANELTRDFFNGNDALLKFGLNDFGFDIKYNAQDKSLKAVFKLQEGNGVNVPNDVLIQLMDKTTGAVHVDQQK